MNAQPFVVSLQDYPRTLNVLGVQITLLASNTATQSYEITLQKRCPRHRGRRRTQHDWDESFFVLTGAMSSLVPAGRSRSRPVRWCTYRPVPCMLFILATAEEACSRSAVPAALRPGCSLKLTGKCPPGRRTYRSWSTSCKEMALPSRAESPRSSLSRGS